MRFNIITFSFVLLISLQSALAQAKRNCTKEDAIRAEAEASSLQDWRQLYSSFNAFAKCDDAAIGEGYSDSVARLLANRWDRAAELARVVSSDKNFEQFILRHIDQLMSPDQAKKIQENATSHCPSNARQLCRSIVARIRETFPHRAIHTEHSHRVHPEYLWPSPVFPECGFCLKSHWTRTSKQL